MRFDFDTAVDRRGIGNMIEESKPLAVREAGLPSYWGAEFDFRTAPAVVQALKAAAERGLFGFTLPDQEYLERVAWWYATQRGCPVQTGWILPTQGTIFSLATTLRAFSDPGDAIVVLVPGYSRYRQAAARLGRRTLASPLLLSEGRYAIDFPALEETLEDSRARILVLCNPNNPTGSIWDASTLDRIAGLAARRGILVFSDEIFADVSFGNRQVLPYHAVAGPESLSIACTSLGKSFGLTGLNHANALIPNPGIRERFLAQRNADHYGSLDPLHRAALMGAYSEEGATWLAGMRQYVWDNYYYIASFFAEHIPGVTVFEPEGSYVLWIDFGTLGLAEAELEAFLQDEALLCLDPGTSYGGAPGFMRMNISVPRAELSRSLGLLLEVARTRGLART